MNYDYVMVTTEDYNLLPDLENALGNKKFPSGDSINSEYTKELIQRKNGKIYLTYDKDENEGFSESDSHVYYAILPMPGHTVLSARDVLFPDSNISETDFENMFK